MRIESVTLENFRQYRTELFRFDRKTGFNDLHIIVGETGEGKSNLLNAITWCLYGEEMHLRDVDTALASLNKEVVSELRESGIKTGKCSVSVVLSSDEDEISRLEITRTANFSVQAESVREIENSLKVITTINGVMDIAGENDALTYIQRYVPRDIINYIFFDGEQLEKYFGSDQENVARGIDSLTQANIITRAVNKLEEYRDNELGNKIKNCGNEHVAACQKKVEFIRTNISITESNIEELNNQCAVCDEEIVKRTQLIHGNEWVPAKQRELQELEEEAPKIKKRLDDKKKALMGFVRDNYFVFALYPALKSYYEYIIKQKQAGQLPPSIDKVLILKSRDEHVCAVCHQPLNGAYYEDIVKLAEKFMVASATSNALSGAETTILGFFDKMRAFPATRDALMDDIKRIEIEKQENENKYQEVYQYLKTVSGAEQIILAIEEREQFEQIRRDLYEKIGMEKSNLRKLEDDLQIAQQDLDKAMSNNRMLKELQHKKDLCDKAIVALRETRNEVLAQCRKDMQDETFRIFTSMHWKTNAFSGVKINDKFKFQLLDMYGDQTLGSASAGESALLALAFTLALQETSKHDSLLYIDTPIGRIGKKDRPEISRVLKELSNRKQVILTFSPTEYDSSVREILADKTSTICHLAMDEDGVTVIRENIKE